MNTPEHWIIGMTRKGIRDLEDSATWAGSFVVETDLDELSLPPVIFEAFRELRPEIHGPNTEVAIGHSYRLLGLPIEFAGLIPRWQKGGTKLWGVVPR